MSLKTVDLGDVAFASYVYCQFTGYDKSYSDFVSRVGGDVRLSDPVHGVALLKWLNEWGCRQFSINQRADTSKRLLKWSAEFSGHLPPPGEPLDALDKEELGRTADAYEALRSVVASVRKDQVQMRVGPTGAGKILFALRPHQLPPWDDPVRKKLGWKGDRESYLQYLRTVQETIRRFHLQLSSLGLEEQAFSALIGRPGVTLPKLIDEYMWMSVTRGFEPPPKTDLEHWVTWKHQPIEKSDSATGGSFQDAARQFPV